MKEPTVRQHKILEQIENEGGFEYKFSNDSDIESYWELVRMGCLRNLVGMGFCDWKFVLTDDAKEYLKRGVG